MLSAVGQHWVHALACPRFFIANAPWKNHPVIAGRRLADLSGLSTLGILPFWTLGVPLAYHLVQIAACHHAPLSVERVPKSWPAMIVKHVSGRSCPRFVWT